jgi:tetratricopeptide (TPR) repeat protein
MSAINALDHHPARQASVDARGCPVSGATRSALPRFEAALALFQTWRHGSVTHLDAALRRAPGFVMAHVLQAYLLVCSRDPRRVRSARPILERAADLPANRFERQHLAALGALLDDDYEQARSRLAGLLLVQPRDALALQVVHALDYLTGDTDRMYEHVAAVLPAWSARLPGYGAVLAMLAFSLEECGDYGRAEHAARMALQLNPFDARAHHVMAHVFEMTGQADAGLRWMLEHAAGWERNTTVATHCWWHMALFHLARGEREQALVLYDQRIRAGRSSDIADLIDASALLWRIQLQGGDAGQRWAELALAWSPHIDDHFCSFNDVHAMLSFVGARDWRRAQQLERSLARSRSRPTRHGAITRQFGLDACRALVAFGRGDDALAISLLAGLPASAHRLGGSNAQRDVLRLTLDHAVERVRRGAGPAPSPVPVAGIGRTAQTPDADVGRASPPGRPAAAGRPGTAQASWIYM